jgi:CheY-like chemotaxis protein
VAGQADIFLQNGFDDFVSKPIDVRQLDRILNRLIRDKHPRDAVCESLPQKLIFIVDGNDDNLIAAASALDSEYRVMTMLTAEKMKSLLEKKRPAVIIADMQMPGIAGIDTAGIPVIPLETPFEPSRLPGIVKEHIK